MLSEGRKLQENDIVACILDIYESLREPRPKFYSSQTKGKLQLPTATEAGEGTRGKPQSDNGGARPVSSLQDPSRTSLWTSELNLSLSFKLNLWTVKLETVFTVECKQTTGLSGAITDS